MKSKQEMAAGHMSDVEECVGETDTEQRNRPSAEMAFEAVDERTSSRKLTCTLNTDSYGFPLSIFTKVGDYF